MEIIAKCWACGDTLKLEPMSRSYGEDIMVTVEQCQTCARQVAAAAAEEAEERCREKISELEDQLAESEDAR